MLRAELPADHLKRAWDRVSGIPSPRSPNDSFALVSLAGYSHGVGITAQNGNVYGLSRCPGKVELDQGQEIPFIVQCEQMAKIVANADGLVTFARRGIVMDVSCPGWKATLPAVAGGFYRPELHESANKYVTRVEPLILGLDSALAATGKAHAAFAVELATLDFRQPNEPVVFGLDGTNASIYLLPVIEEGSVGGIAKLPQQGIKHLISFFRHEEGIVRMKHDINWLVVYNNDCALHVRLAEGSLPDWQKIVNSNSSGNMMRVDRQELASAIRAASLAVDLESTDEASIDIVCDAGTMTLDAESSKYGHSEATVRYDGGSEVHSSFTLHARRLLKAVAIFQEPTIELGLSDNNTGVIFRAGDLTWLLALIVQGEDNE